MTDSDKDDADDTDTPDNADEDLSPGDFTQASIERPEWWKAAIERLYKRHMDADHLEVSFEDRFVKVVFDQDATSTVRTVIAHPRGDRDGHVVAELNHYEQADNEAMFDIKPVDMESPVESQ